MAIRHYTIALFCASVLSASPLVTITPAGPDTFAFMAAGDPLQLQDLRIQDSMTEDVTLVFDGNTELDVACAANALCEFSTANLQLGIAARGAAAVSFVAGGSITIPTNGAFFEDLTTLNKFNGPQAPVSTTPEPSTALMLITGLGLTVMGAQRKPK